MKIITINRFSKEKSTEKPKWMAMLGIPEISPELFKHNVEMFIKQNPAATIDEVLCEFTGRALAEASMLEWSDETISNILEQQISIIKKMM